MPTDSVLTAVVLGFFWALFKVVEYLVTRKKNNKWGKEQDKKLTELHTIIVARVKSHEKFMTNLEKVLEEIDEKVCKLNEMHCVYDENLIPRWYVQPEMMKTIRQIHNILESSTKEIEDGFGEVKDNQSVLVDRIIDLISSQKLMVERLGDLINKLHRITNN